MGERSEIAARAHRALLGHDRVNAGVEHRNHRVERPGIDARVPRCERVDAQQQNRADDIFGEWVTHSGRVASDQVQLKTLEVGLRDDHVAEIPEAGVDPVDDFVSPKDVLHHLPGRAHPFLRFFGERNALAADGHTLDLIEGKVLSGQLDRHRVILYYPLASPPGVSVCSAPVSPVTFLTRVSCCHSEKNDTPSGGFSLRLRKADG